LAKRTNAQKVEGKGGEEDRDCDGRAALREIYKDWADNEEQQQERQELENVYRECSERKVRRGKN